MDKFKKEILLIFEKIKVKNPSYLIIINDLIKKLENEELKKENQEQIQFALILLNFIKGNISIIGLNVNKINKDLKNNIKKIVVQFNEKPFCNLNKEINNLKPNQNEFILNLINSFEISYLNGQINFIKKSYKKIIADNLQNFFGKNFLIDNEFLNKNGWKREKNYVIINDDSDYNKKNLNNIDVNQAINDIKFIGENTIKLDKIIQANILISPIEKIYN
jgi:hypothetical protein